MKLHRKSKVFIIYLLSFLIAFEPFAVNALYANSGNANSSLYDAGAGDEPDGMGETPRPTVEEESALEDGVLGEDGFESLDVVKPGEYLEYMLSLRGMSVEDSAEVAIEKEKALAWGEWMNTITGAYSLMDEGCTDVLSFYDSLGEVCNKVNDARVEIDKMGAYVECLKFAANKACLAGAFLAKITRLDKLATNIKNWAKGKECLMKGFAGMGRLYKSAANSKFVKGTGTFLSHMCPPVGFSKGCEAGEGFKAYWRWVRRKDVANPTAEVVKNTANNARMTWNEFQHANKGKGMTSTEMSQAWKEYKAGNSGTSATNGATEGMSNVKGVAHTVGIALTVIGIALDGYAIWQDATEGDFAAGYRWTYENVKNNVSLALGVASLVAMFCVPVVGQVIGAIALIWTCLTIIGDELGEYNKKWKESYKDSFWFLYNNDPEFKSYYDNRDELTKDEKSAAYIITEKNYADFKQNARNFESQYKGTEEYYDSNTQEAISARVYIELEKQGVVTSYYNRSSFKLPDFSMDRLVDMWRAKADLMAWKPTEEEQVRAENRGFWGSIGHALNPMTYVSWAGDKINTKKFEKYNKYNHDKVYYNPDFVLLKKYQNWITTHKKMKDRNDPTNQNDFYRAIGIRLEQSPFNYIPLVGIDNAAWSDELLIEAFNCDAFFIGIKEMMYFKNVIESATEKVEEQTDETTDTIIALKESVDTFNKRAKILEDLLQRYRLNKDVEKEGEDFFKDNKSDLKNVFPKMKKWEDSYGPCTPENIMSHFWNEIDTALAVDALSVAQKAVECRLMLDSIQRNLDTCSLMLQLYEEKRAALENFDNEFQNYDIKRYLKENQFLDVDGGGFMDWLSGLKPAWDELNKYNNLYKKKVDDYIEAVENSNKGHKKVFLGLFKKEDSDYHPKAVIEELKKTLDKYKTVVGDYEAIAGELNKSGLSLTPTDKDIFDIKGIETANLPNLSRYNLIDQDGNVKEFDERLTNEINESLAAIENE